MKKLRLIAAAIAAASLCAGAAAWFRHRPAPADALPLSPASAQLPSPREELARKMAGWLLREGRRQMRSRRFLSAAAMADATAFFAGEEGARPLRESLRAELAAMRVEWSALASEGAEAGDPAAGRLPEGVFEEDDELEATGAVDPR